MGLGKEKLDNLFYFILIIPVLNVVSSIATPFFPGGLNPGVLRGILLTVFLAWYLVAKYKQSKYTNVLMIYTVYIFILCWFSEEVNTSFYIYNKFFVSSLMFVIAFENVRSPKRFLLMQRAFLISLGAIIIYFAFSNVAGIGNQSYQDDSVLFGESGVNITKSIVIFLIGIPLYQRLEPSARYKLLATGILLIGIVTILLGMKRSAILATGFGFLFYTLLTPYKSRLIRTIPIILILLIVSAPYYLPIIEKRFEARQERVSMTVDQLQQNETEGRVLEFYFTLDDTFGEGNVARALFGFDVFLKKDFMGHKRMLHVDYNNMLGGAGMVGLFLFIFVYVRILQDIFRIRGFLKESLLIREIFATSVALVAVQAFLSLGGTMQGINLRGYILMYLGALLGFSVYLYKTKLASGNQQSKSIAV